MRPQPTAAAEARSLTPKAKLSGSTPLTWTDSPAGRSESPSSLCVRCWKQRRNSGSASRFVVAGPRRFRWPIPSPLKGPSQRELDQARSAYGLHDRTERVLAYASVRDPGVVGLDVGHGWVAEVRVIPNIEEVRGQAEFLTFGNLEVLENGRVPILLERTVVKITAQVAETGSAEVRIGGAFGGRIKRSRGGEGRWIQVSVDSLVDVAAGQAACDGCARSEACTQ